MGLAQLRDQWEKTWWKLPRTNASERVRWQLAYLCFDTREALVGYRGRLLCRLLHLHGTTCRGRQDHTHRPMPHPWMQRCGW